MARSTIIDGRSRSVVTLPGYRLGVRPANAGKTYPTEVPTTEEILALMAACSRHGSAGIRDRALIAVLWRAGLRISEALALRPKDINLAAGEITVLHGKGDRRRTVGIDADAVGTIEVWLARRAKLGIGPNRPVFCNIQHPRRGRQLHSSTFRTKLHALGARAGIQKWIVPHALRHAHASHLARKGVGVNLIQRQLGHKSLRTTVVYLDGIAPWEVVDAVRRLDWGPQLTPAAKAPMPPPLASGLPHLSDEEAQRIGPREIAAAVRIIEHAQLAGFALHQGEQEPSAAAGFLVDTVDHRSRAA